MRKLFTLVTLLCAVLTAGAASFPDATYLDVPNKKSNPELFFTMSSKYAIQGFTGTSKFNGNSYTTGLKQEKATETKFTTTDDATITIVQTTLVNSDKTVKLNDKELSAWADCIKTTYDASSDDNNQNVYVYKIHNVSAGDYSVTQGSGQSYLLYIGVTYGKTSKVNIEANTTNGGTSTVTGTGDYLPGATATLTAVPAAGKALDHWELGGSNVSTANPYSFTVTTAATYSAVFVDAATKTISVASGNDAVGTAKASANTVSEGSNTTLTATVTAAEGYVFSNWTKSSDGSWSSTTNPLTISYDDLVEGDTYTANFKALYTVTYDLGTYAGTTNKVLNNYDPSNSINEKYASAADKYTIPSYAHRYLYNEGNVLTGWTDGVNTYNTGDEITLTANTTLTPVWKATTQTLANSNAETTVTWTLDKAQILFNAWQGDTNVGYYTKPHTINGELIAVPMKIDATAKDAKIDNSTRSGNTQINKGTTFTIPAVSGMKITVNRTDNTDWSAADPKTTVNGENMTVDEEKKKATYTYTGSADEVIIALNSGRYYTSIVVTYPATTISVDITAAGYATFCSNEAVDFSASGAEVYTAAVSGSNAVLTKVTSGKVPANTGVILKGTGTVTGTVIASAEALTGNELVGVLADYTTTGNYILVSDGAGSVKFAEMTEGTLKAGKAYLPKAGDARELNISFGDATAISTVKAAAEDGAIYTLSGARVAQPTKGLYIQNGKKVIVK